MPDVYFLTALEAEGQEQGISRAGGCEGSLLGLCAAASLVCPHLVEKEYPGVSLSLSFFFFFCLSFLSF